MTTKQEEVNEDLKEMTISHLSEILEEHPNKNKAQVAEDDQRNDVMKSTYDRAQITESIRMLDKRNDEARELTSKLEDDGLVQDIGKKHYQEKETNQLKDVSTNDKSQREVNHVEKINEAIQEIDAMIRNQELIHNEILVIHDSPNSCEKMIITNDKAIVPKIISGQIKVENKTEKENKSVISYE
ncbi:1589_t:CDS:2 [Acaulospora morrowiae]|uniref:1589_t:CDS:1 n=1 Tax=Acaulospora morrowiae TaxID=94023 RepID=A0A9N9DCR2_9GLOM|nr:1589_t:CDS:2 [Acaulospora morrowiae]